VEKPFHSLIYLPLPNLYTHTYLHTFSVTRYTASAKRKGKPQGKKWQSALNIYDMNDLESSVRGKSEVIKKGLKQLVSSESTV